MAHTVAEAWIPTLNKWVIMDPTFDVTFLVNGQPASALDLHELSRKGRLDGLSIQEDGLGRVPHFRIEPGLLALFRHLTTSQTNAVFDGYGVGLFRLKHINFVHLVDNVSEPYPNSRKYAAIVMFFLCLAAAAFLFIRTAADAIKPFLISRYRNPFALEHSVLSTQSPD